MPKLVLNWVGQTVGEGRYYIEAKLGEGGMGTVYRALDRVQGQVVALKTPRIALLEDPQFFKRFQREMKALAQLRHPHLVPVLDIGEHNRIPFLVMQFLPGGSLRERLRERFEVQGRYEPIELFPWLEQIASALDYLHSRKVIHRDVKPGNILFDDKDVAYLSDLGAIKVQEGSEVEAHTQLTQAGTALGTPPYIAPEVLLGQTYDGRADQYALATIVYEALSGQRPYFADSLPALVKLILTGPEAERLDVLCGAPVGVADAVARGLARDPAQRFASCMEFARAVRLGLISTSVPAALGNQSRTPHIHDSPAPSVQSTPEPVAKIPAGPTKQADATVQTCPHCGKSWRTSGGKSLVSCPFCMRVVTNPIITYPKPPPLPPGLSSSAQPTGTTVKSVDDHHVQPSPSAASSHSQESTPAPQYASRPTETVSPKPVAQIPLTFGTTHPDERQPPCESVSRSALEPSKRWLGKPLVFWGGMLSGLLCLCLILLALFLMGGGPTDGQSELASAPVTTPPNIDGRNLENASSETSKSPMELPHPSDHSVRKPDQATSSPRAPTTWHVDFVRLTLDQAIGLARPGDIIVVAPGRFTLQECIIVDKPLTIRGAGLQKTHLVSPQALFAMEFRDKGPWILENLTVEHIGLARANVVVVTGGEIIIRNCRFMGGSFEENAQPPQGGCGVLFLGAVRGQMISCISDQNTLHGIHISDRAQLLLENNICENNSVSGIAYSGEASGTARNNTCRHNGFHGIAVQGQAQPTLEGNKCENNKQCGLAYSGKAGGTAKKNVCRGNQLYHGIQVGGDCQPELEENVCENNGKHGILFWENAGGTARHNACRSNGLHGIAVLNQAKPTLDSNTCEKNSECGIAYFNNAAGTAENNKCVNNKLNGITILDQAKPLLKSNICRDNGLYGVDIQNRAEPMLEGNICEQNRFSGFAYFHQAGGIARNNLCRANKKFHGIQVGDNCNPVLDGNTCESNGGNGIFFWQNARGTTSNNKCNNNGLNGIAAEGQAQPTLEGNTCEENKQSGIAYFDNAGGTARNNTCRNNGHYGILISNTARPVLGINSLFGNTLGDVGRQ
ncbi:MAG: right-handed parallel beta-helix repeat-containing protein [Gemmatales bacterium]|nr:right-handed parallel beta-helix repeat-containing protein [Gemmatales bacterium]